MASAVILDPRKPIKGLDDSKVLTPARRQLLHDEIMARAVDVATVSVEHDECDRLGMHQADLHALRRSVARLSVQPAFVLTDGFPVDGLGVPGLGIWKGDKVAACVSAASIIAKVTRDAIMVRHHDTYPVYGFDIHKGYCTAGHQAALEEHGPCDIHRWCFDNVVRTARVGSS